MQETPAGTTYDSTSNDNDGITSGMDSADQVAGQIDGSLDFDGGDDVIDVGMSDLEDYSTLTISAFAYMTAKTIDRVIVSQGSVNNCQLRYDVGTDEWYFQAHDGSYQYAVHQADVNLSTWVHIVGVYDGTNTKIYIDGVVGNTVGTLGTMSANDGATQIGNNLPNADREWVGIIDEVRISNVARSAGWIATEYNNQVSVGEFMTFGEEECLSVPAERSGGENVKTMIKGGTTIRGGVRF